MQLYARVAVLVSSRYLLTGTVINSQSVSIRKVLDHAASDQSL